MAPLTNMPTNNNDFNALLIAFQEHGLFDEHIVTHIHQFEVDYASPGPYPKHNVKTNYVRGHGKVDYTEDEDPLWPQHNRIMTDTFIAPLLPEGEIEVTPTLLPHPLRNNPNVTQHGPKLTVSRRGLITISMVSLRCGYVVPMIPAFNPFSPVLPYTLFLTEVKALNALYAAVVNDTPTFPDFDSSNLEELMVKFTKPIQSLVTGIQSAEKVRPYIGGRGNRGWFHILNMEFAPIMWKLRDLVVDDDLINGLPEPSGHTKACISNLIQAMTAAVLALDPRMGEAEDRQLYELEAQEVAREAYDNML